MPTAAELDADLDGIFNDWNDSLTEGGTDYPGIYQETNIESGNFQGYAPLFTGKTSDLIGINKNTIVTISSDIQGLTAVAFKVVEKNRSGRLMRLILEKS